MKRRFKLLVVGLVLIFGGLAVVKGNFWTVRGIRCSFNGETCPPQLWQDLSGASLGKDFLFFSKPALVRQINLNYPEVEGIAIDRVLPAELAFQLTASAAQAVVKGDQYFLVNDRGLVLKVSDSPGDLPVILMDSVKNLGVGEKFIQPEIIFTIEILEKLNQRALHPTMAKIISPQRAEMWLNNGPRVTVSLAKEAGPQLDSLQVILARVRMEGRALREIDLRFDKPVITYE